MHTDDHNQHKRKGMIVRLIHFLEGYKVIVFLTLDFSKVD